MECPLLLAAIFGAPSERIGCIEGMPSQGMALAIATEIEVMMVGWKKFSDNEYERSKAKSELPPK